MSPNDTSVSRITLTMNPTTLSPTILRHVVAPENMKRRNPSEGFFDNHVYKPTNQFAKQLLYETVNGLRFTEHVCSYFGINTDKHEAVVKEIIEQNLIPRSFWDINWGNGVKITEGIQKVYNTDLIFATTHDYFPSFDEKGKIPARREHPLDSSLQSKIDNVSKKLSPLSKRHSFNGISQAQTNTSTSQENANSLRKTRSDGLNKSGGFNFNIEEMPKFNDCELYQTKSDGSIQTSSSFCG